MTRSAREDWAPEFCASGTVSRWSALFLVLAGRGVFSDGRREWPLRRASLAFWPQGRARAFWCQPGDPMRVHFLDLVGRGWPRILQDALGSRHGVVQMQRPETLLDACNGIHDLARRGLASGGVVAGHLLQAALIAIAEEQVDSAALRCWRQARQLIVDQPRQAWTVAGLADRLGVSCSYLARVCRQQGDGTPGQMLRRLRFATCLEDLRDGRALVEVAATLGYADAASFGKAFRKTIGMPPGAFRAV